MPFLHSRKSVILFMFLSAASAAFTASAAPQAAQQVPAAASVVSGQFALGGNVAQVPIKVSGHLVFVPVRINGARPSWFLLDTAHRESSLDDVRAAALGLSTPGTANAKSISNAVLQFPGLKISVPTLALRSFSDLSSRVGRPVQGVLGARALSHFVVVIRYHRQTLQLYDPRAFHYSGHGEQLKMQILGGVPAISAKLSIPHRGNLGGIFSLATAQPEALQFFPGFASAYRFSALNERMILYSPLESPRDIDDHLGRVHAFQFGKMVFQDPLAIFPGKSERTSTHASSQLAGAIGGEILDRFTLILDYPGQLAIFEPNPHFADLFAADMSGLVLVATPPDFRAFEVARVIEKSPAAAAGIAVGDMIEKIDGNPAYDYSLRDVRALLREDSTEHTLTVLRNGQTLQFTLKLKPLV